MSPPWMPLYIADYLADTRHLHHREHGPYLLLIMEYWRKEGLPDDDAYLATVIGATPREWMALRPKLSALFGPGWSHKRIDAELAKANVKHERRQKAGQRGGKAKAKSKQCSSNASRLLEQKRSNSLASSSELTDTFGIHPSEGMNSLPNRGDSEGEAGNVRWDAPFGRAAS